MKTLIITIALAIMTIASIAQNEIVLKSGNKIKNARLYEVKSEWIIYEKNGNLHDLMKEEILFIAVDGVKVNIDTGKPLTKDELPPTQNEKGSNTAEKQVVAVQDKKPVLTSAQRPKPALRQRILFELTGNDLKHIDLFSTYDINIFTQAVFFKQGKLHYCEIYFTHDSSEVIHLNLKELSAIRDKAGAMRANTNNEYSVITPENFAQKLVPARKDFKPYSPKAIVTGDPLQLIGLKPRIHFCLEIPMSTNVSLMGEYGYMFDNKFSLSILNDYGRIDYGHSLTAGLRFSAHKRKPPLRNTIYFAGTCTVNSIHHQSYDWDGLAYVTDVTTTLGLQMGRQYIFYNKFVLDYYWGLGYNTTHHSPAIATGLRLGMAI